MMWRVSKAILIVICFGLSPLQGAVVCNEADVQAALNKALDGETVQVLEGRCTWSTLITIPSNKDITLQGAGIGKTVITGTNVKLIAMTGRTRLTGFTFESLKSAGATNGNVTAGGEGWRIDHNEFKGGAPITTWGDGPGLIDHNTFVDGNAAINIMGSGDASWQTDYRYGGGFAIYIETNTFIYTGGKLDGAIDAYNGARYVFRYNRVSGTTIGHHGFDSGPWRGTRVFEIYHNTFVNPNTALFAIGNFRSGTGVVFKNVVSAAGGSFNSFLKLQNYRSSDQYTKELANNWDICDGSSAHDGNNADGQGYPCRDQIGRGMNQTLSPLYAWDNDYKGAVGVLSPDNSPGGQRLSTYHVLKNRDFFQDVAMPSYAPFAYPYPLKTNGLPIDPARVFEPTEKKAAVTQYGITWTFDKPYEVGQFANGDYWVVGPVTIIRIEPDFDGRKNGWEVNPASQGIQPDMKQGLDSMTSAFDAALVPALPYLAAPGESILKSVHADCAPNCTNSTSVLQTAAVLSVLDQVPPDRGATVFRPPYVGTAKPLFRTTALRTDILPSLAPVSGAPSLDSIRNAFARVQLDHFYAISASWRNLHPLDNLPDYGGDIGRRNSEMLRLFLNDPLEKKMPALIAYVQYGIDLTYMYALGQNWSPGGSGHKPGQALPLAFSAVLLNDTRLKNILSTIASSRIEENVSTYRNTRGTVLFGQVEGTGASAEKHYWDSVQTHEGFKTRKDPYEFIDGGYTPGTSYQSIITPIFRSEVLAADLMPEIKTVWYQREFFEYVHRSMNIGAWAQPDPCAPYDGTPENYGKTFGPNGSGGCILDRDASDGIGRFPTRHGVAFYAGAYRTVFQDAMWEMYHVSASTQNGTPDLNDSASAPTLTIRPFQKVVNTAKGEALLMPVLSTIERSAQITVIDRFGSSIKSFLHLLARGETTISWDGRNSKGEFAAAGVYMIVVRTDAATLKQKIIIVR